MNKKFRLIVASLCMLGTSLVYASDIPGQNCNGLPDFADLRAAIGAIPDATDQGAYGGFGFNMWVTVVDADGFVCAVAFTGDERHDQWPASRVIATQKASTANSLCHPGFALSTANLYASAQPGGDLFGVQFSNPVDTGNAYGGDPTRYGRAEDPMVGTRVGGHNVFGGGLCLYDEIGNIIGGLGASGDSSCKDHNYAWFVRDQLGLDNPPAGVNPDGARVDNIIYDMGDSNAGNFGTSASGFGHVDCGLGENAISQTLPSNGP